VSNVAAAFRLFFWLLYYLINNVAPEPFRRVLNIILVCIFVLVLIVFLLERFSIQACMDRRTSSCGSVFRVKVSPSTTPPLQIFGSGHGGVPCGSAGSFPA